MHAFFSGNLPTTEVEGQSLSHLNLERKIPNGQFPNHRDSKNANICTAAVTKKRFHVYNKTDHKPQVSQKGQEKMWAKNRDRKQCQSFITLKTHLLLWMPLNS